MQKHKMTHTGEKNVTIPSLACMCIQCILYTFASSFANDDAQSRRLTNSTNATTLALDLLICTSTC